MTVVGIDLECSLILPGRQFPRPVSLQLISDAEPTPRIYDAHEIPRVLGPLLDKSVATASVWFIAHNLPFDWGCLWQHFPTLRPALIDVVDKGRALCTKVREQLLDIADHGYRRGTRDRTLDTLADKYLGRSLDKGADGWRLRYSELAHLPVSDWPERARTYALDDASTLLDVYRAQEDRAVALHYGMATQALETRAAVALALVGAWGMHVDTPRARRALRAVQERDKELRTVLLAQGILKPKRVKDRKALEAGADVDAVQVRKDTKLVRSLVESVLGDDAPKTKTGLVKADAETLEACAAEHPALLECSERDGLVKQASTYLAKLTTCGGRIHGRFDPLGAASSRSSCANINMQNQPRRPGVRECYIARPGRVLLACDYSTQELRTLAQTTLWLTDKSAMAEAYQANPDIDLHAELAAASGFSRQEAKAGNFGFPGGMGARKLRAYARGLGIDVAAEDATAIRDAWFNRWPEMADYFALVGSFVGIEDGDATIELPSGFRRAGCGFTNACNGFFQGLAAHASKTALWRVVVECIDPRKGSALYGDRAVNFVHDEIILDVDPVGLDDKAKRVALVMEEAQAQHTPDVPARAQAAAMFAWTKTDPVYDDAGGLVVVEA